MTTPSRLSRPQLELLRHVRKYSHLPMNSRVRTVIILKDAGLLVHRIEGGMISHHLTEAGIARLAAWK